jgi:hypothetical protein
MHAQIRPARSVTGERLDAMPAVQATASHHQSIPRVIAESDAIAHPSELHLCAEKVHLMRLLALLLWRPGAATTTGTGGGIGQGSHVRGSCARGYCPSEPPPCGRPGRLGEIGPCGDKIRSVVEVVGSSPMGPWVFLGLFVAVE